MQAESLIPAEDIPCSFKCHPGFHCRYGVCVRRNCTLNCSGVAIEPVCASNGVTYNNLCELEKVKCDLALDMEYYNGTCMYTLPDNIMMSLLVL